jgi:hypothetical protein
VRRNFFKLLFLLTLLTGVPAGVYLVGRATGFIGHAGGMYSNLVIGANLSYPTSNFDWQNLAQGGEEQGNMFSGVEGTIGGLHTKYIRIDHVFDFYDIGNTWVKLDDVIASIGKMGAKPFISLSPLPDTPINWGDWETKVQRVVEHISGTLGLSGVYYEVGNEPDLFGGWKTYGNKNYLDLYAHSVAGASRAGGVRQYKIGGPATTALYQSWVQGLAKFVLDNHLRFDFYSWHRYSLSMSDFENDGISAKTWLVESGMPDNIELVISEAGPDSNNNSIYDNGFGAIHALAVSASVEDSVNKVFNFEVKDGPKNTWGILKHDGGIKPRYYALSFLNQMGGNRMITYGQGSWVKAFTKMDGKTIKTLIVNYDPQGKHIEAVPITYVGLPSTNFNYKRINWGGGVEKDLKVGTDSANWATFELMNPNTAAIVEIIPD